MRLSLYVQLHIYIYIYIRRVILYMHELRFEKIKLDLCLLTWDHTLSNKITMRKSKFLCEWAFTFVYI